MEIRKAEHRNAAPKLRHQLFERVSLIPEAFAELPVQTVRRTAPMGQSHGAGPSDMPGGRTGAGTAEQFAIGYLDTVLARAIQGPMTAVANVSTGGLYERCDPLR